MMKKVFSVLLTLALCLCFLAGCGDSQPSDTPVTPVDVDLTLLSSTMVYSEVYNMMSNPEQYVGKTVRMHGQYSVFSNQDRTQYYPAVVIADATACCSQGIEFVLKGAPYPTGYPAYKSIVTVCGTFDTYLEDGVTYCHIVDATLE